MKRILLNILVTILLIGCNSSNIDNDLKLWYDKPAIHFEEALVIGNGKTGATVFGGVHTDKIHLNDATLWSGEPVDRYMNPETYKNIPAVREALENEDYKLAEQLNKKIQGKFSQSYAPLGTMYLEFNKPKDIVDYYRELDISNAVAKVKYKCDGVTYYREYLVSNPDKLMVIKLSADKKNALNFNLKFDSQLKYKTVANQNGLEISGYAPYHTVPSYWGSDNPVRFDEKRGTRFSAHFNVLNEGGEVIVSDSGIQVNEANEVILHICTATSFNGFDKNPASQGLDNQSIAKQLLRQSAIRKYETIKTDHIKDYQSFFNRVKLQLGDFNSPDLPTDQRLIKYTEGAEDKGLEILYFQYGRYLLISSSRTDQVPANLQGIWNPYIRPPWSSNYTMNINVEENYWLAESANLSEMHQPFLNFIGNLAETGKVTAKTFYGVDKGWAACHNSDIWAMSNPVGDFGYGDPMWACWNMSGTWVVTHLWDHYLYSGDKEFLSSYAYPLMKGAAEFCLNWLVEDKNGNLITSPSTSPENTYITSDGLKGATLYGATCDLAMIRECFGQTIKASQILNIDASLRDSMSSALSKLYPYQIGKKGNLQEWYHDWEDAEPQHRHQTHLFGLHPGNHITPLTEPNLAEACRTSLEIKGDETTGWSKGWRINLWARLWDGNRAYKLYRELLTYVSPNGVENVNYGGGGGTYPNLLDAHPPFQIDGNFGGAAGVIEMLMQSNEERIILLPAIPDVWSEGTVTGLCARGGFEISMKWKEGKLSEVEVLSKIGNRCSLKYDGKTIGFDTKVDGKYCFVYTRGELKNRI
nr:glycoside hydrolase family 95 protein [uncultured Carboxylicivirga sp.]